MADEKIMNRVRALLERAAHPTTPPAEAKLCEEKADALMAQHMIDRMDLTVEEKATIIKAHWDIRVNDAGKDSHEFYGVIMSLLQNVLRHCNIRINPRVEYPKDENGKTNYSLRRMTLVGFPEDIAYAEQVWFVVFKTFIMNVSPKWDTSKSLADNVYEHINAGFTWNRLREIAYNAVPDHYGIPPLDPAKPNSGGGKLLKAYREALEARGEERNKTKRHTAYRASFARSYSATIGDRLYEMRSKAKEAVSDSDKFALALRDTKEQVDAEFYRLFPEYDPEVRRRMAEQEAAEAAAEFAKLSPEEQARQLKKQADEEARWARRSSRARSNYGRVRESDRTDMGAWRRGKQVADSVNLRADAKVKNAQKGELK
jgi:hypothetical protein